MIASLDGPAAISGVDVAIDLEGAVGAAGPGADFSAFLKLGTDVVGAAVVATGDGASAVAPAFRAGLVSLTGAVAVAGAAFSAVLRIGAARTGCCGASTVATGVGSNLSAGEGADSEAGLGAAKAVDLPLVRSPLLAFSAAAFAISCAFFAA